MDAAESPPSGAGARAGNAASWGARLAAVTVDWFASMLVAVLIFGGGVITAHDYRAWMTLAVFFVEKSILTSLLGGSFGQLLLRVAVMTEAGERVSLARAAARSALVCLVVPAIVSNPERRTLADVLTSTVTVNRRSWGPRR